MTPPYAGRRTAADAAYKVGDVKEARRLPSTVVPAKAGTHTPCPSVGARGQRPFATPGPTVMGPCFRTGDKYHHTAILRWRTGAPAVKASAASMMALASMPWWR